MYITVRQSPRYHQLSLEEFLGLVPKSNIYYRNDESNTKTYVRDVVPEKFAKRISVDVLINELKEFNKLTEGLRSKDRSSLYYSFHIPKRSGGLRRIDAPEAELKNALNALKTIFEQDFHTLYHTSAFAYVKGRSTVSAVKKHQENESRWYAKYDLSNFFGSTTLDYTMKMFSEVYPFSEVVKNDEGKSELMKALELAFLNGGLPQGTPISPLITNVIMIPVDFKLSNALRDFEGKHYIYTRYADDFHVSSKYDFDFRKVEQLIINTLEEFGAPFAINTKKTRYGSIAGRNWMLGVMVNKDNNITVGHEKKRQFKAMLDSFIKDTKNGNPWSREDIQVMEGLRSYYTMIEGDTITGIVNHASEKNGVDVIALIKSQLNL